MPSKRITTFRSAAHPVIAGALETALEVAGSLGEVYDAFLGETETPIDWSLLQKLVSRRLTSRGLRLAELDARLEVGRTADQQLRRDRDRLVATLRRPSCARRASCSTKASAATAPSGWCAGATSRRCCRRRWCRWRGRRRPRCGPRRLLAKSLHPAAVAGPAPDALPEPAALADALERRALELEQLLEAAGAETQA